MGLHSYGKCCCYVAVVLLWCLCTCVPVVDVGSVIAVVVVVAVVAVVHKSVTKQKRQGYN